LCFFHRFELDFLKRAVVLMKELPLSLLATILVPFLYRTLNGSASYGVALLTVSLQTSIESPTCMSEVWAYFLLSSIAVH